MKKIQSKGDTEFGNREVKAISVDSRGPETVYLLGSENRFWMRSIQYKKWNFSSQQPNDFSYDADEGCYDGYHDKNLPEGYTAYGENGCVESVYMYDRYEYDLAESPTAHRQKRSLCKRMRSFCSDMGRLIRLIIYCSITREIKFLDVDFFFT